MTINAEQTFKEETTGALICVNRVSKKGSTLAGLS